jgi:proteasome accessory factor C
MTAQPRRRGARNAQDRVRQLLIMLPWLMERGEVPLAAVAERFGLSESEVTKDLELVAMCGLPPYVDEMVDVFVDDGMVFVGVPRLFTRPLRLTAPEGFALLVAARAAMELPGADPDGPLARGLAKLADALGQAGLDALGRAGDDTAGVVVDLERPALTDEIVDAVGDGAELAIDYFSPVRGDVSRRTVVPRHVFADAGNWYLVADNVSESSVSESSVSESSVSESSAIGGSGERVRRTFRIDRIESLERTGTRHQIDHDAGAPSAFFTDIDVPRARLRLLPPAQWIIDRYPVDSVERPVERTAKRSAIPDAVDVVLPIASEWWLNRLLVRLGPNAQLIEPSGAGDGAQALATRILANYQANSHADAGGDGIVDPG